jgi:hypothetical protein
LLLATVFWGLPLCISVVIAIGLWRGSTPSWWTALLFDLLGLVFFSWQGIPDSSFQNTVGIVLFAVPTVMLLLPSVRRFYDVPHKPIQLLETKR